MLRIRYVSAGLNATLTLQNRNYLHCFKLSGLEIVSFLCNTGLLYQKDF